MSDLAHNSPLVYHPSSTSRRLVTVQEFANNPLWKVPKTTLPETYLQDALASPSKVPLITSHVCQIRMMHRFLSDYLLLQRKVLLRLHMFSLILLHTHTAFSTLKPQSAISYNTHLTEIKWFSDTLQVTNPAYMQNTVFSGPPLGGIMKYSKISNKGSTQLKIQDLLLE